MLIVATVGVTAAAVAAAGGSLCNGEREREEEGRMVVQIGVILLIRLWRSVMGFFLVWIRGSGGVVSWGIENCYLSKLVILFTR